MDLENTLLPGEEKAPVEFDTPSAVQDAVAEVPPIVPPFPEPIDPVEITPPAPVPGESPLLDPEISAILGAEVSAILEADWARKSGRASVGSAPAKKSGAPVSQKPVAPAAPAKASGKFAQPQKQGKKASAQKKKTKSAPKKRSLGRKIFCFVRRTLLVVLLVVVLVVAAAALACHTIFHGPSQAAKEMLYDTLMEPSGTKWIPGLFLSQEELDALENRQSELPPSAEISGEITINTNTSINGANEDEWKDHPDGIRIEHIVGESYTAHIMIIRDPSRIYLGTSNRDFEVIRPGMRLDDAVESFGAVAGINGGAFWDNGTSDPRVGTIPEGLVISKGEVLWTQQDTFSIKGFAGFTQDNVLVVAKSMTAKQAKELGIRDGVGFGPVLIIDGKSVPEVYNDKSGGQNPRTCIGQRADGAVIFVCIDGRQANSLGGTYADCIDILTEYGAVNACNMDGGSSSTMIYRDVYGKYKDKGEVFMVNNYSLLQEKPRRLPTFFLVAPEKEGE